MFNPATGEESREMRPLLAGPYTARGERADSVDHARLLGPIGTIDDPDERRDLVPQRHTDALGATQRRARERRRDRGGPAGPEAVGDAGPGASAT